MSKTVVLTPSAEPAVRYVLSRQEYDDLIIDLDRECIRAQRFPLSPALAVKYRLSLDTIFFVFDGRIQKSEFHFVQQKGVKNKDAYLHQAWVTAQASTPPRTMLQLALGGIDNFVITPWMVARRILNYKDISHNREVWSKLADDNLVKQLQECYDVDLHFSPAHLEQLRAYGLYYECQLVETIRSLGIACRTEADFRIENATKTPDVKLMQPFSFYVERGGKRQVHVVHWIDSKAAFGDPETLKPESQIGEQLLSYKNRFGSGLVIFWFGYVAGYEIDPGIAIAHKLPSDIHTLIR